MRFVDANGRVAAVPDVGDRVRVSGTVELYSADAVKAWCENGVLVFSVFDVSRGRWSPQMQPGAVGARGCYQVVSGIVEE